MHHKMDHQEVTALMHIAGNVGTTDHTLVHIRNHAIRRLREINDEINPHKEVAPGVEASPPTSPGTPAVTEGVVSGQVAEPAAAPETTQPTPQMTQGRPVETAVPPPAPRTQAPNSTVVDPVQPENTQATPEQSVGEPAKTPASAETPTVGDTPLRRI